MSDLAKLQADMDFIKHLAVEGRELPLNSGGPLFLAGLIFGLAALLHYALATFDALALVSTGMIWGGAMLCYALGMGVWSFGYRKKHHSPGTKNRIIGVLWGAVGFSIFLITVIFSIIAYRAQNPAIAQAMAPLVLVLYGLGWLITAYIAEQRWINWISAGCVLFALLVAWFVSAPTQILIYALALFGVALVPGWILLKKEQAAQ